MDAETATFYMAWIASERIAAVAVSGRCRGTHGSSHQAVGGPSDKRWLERQLCEVLRPYELDQAVRAALLYRSNSQSRPIADCRDRCRRSARGREGLISAASIKRKCSSAWSAEHSV